MMGKEWHFRIGQKNLEYLIIYCMTDCIGLDGQLKRHLPHQLGETYEKWG